MYLGGVPPNTPPYSQWGALIYAGTAGDSRRCQKGTGLPSMWAKPWLNLTINHSGIIGGMPPRCIRFAPSLKW